jgi:hypothetical protein
MPIIRSEKSDAKIQAVGFHGEQRNNQTDTGKDKDPAKRVNVNTGSGHVKNCASERGHLDLQNRELVSSLNSLASKVHGEHFRPNRSARRSMPGSSPWRLQDSLFSA